MAAWWKSLLVLAALSRAPAQTPHVRDFVYAPMKDGVKLAVVTYRPAKDGKFPVLITYNPYTGGGTDFTPEIEDYVGHGYAVAAASIRGTGCSEGNYYRHGTTPSESQDGVTLIEWAAAQPWSTGEIGMFGNSYPGGVQIGIAALHPKHLRVIGAGGLTSNGYDQSSYPGGIFNFGQSATWTYSAQPNSSAEGVRLRTGAGDSQCASNRQKQAPLTRFSSAKEHPLRDAHWRNNNGTLAARIEIPAMIFQGWQDEQCAVNGGIEIFKALKGPKRLVLSNGMHAFYTVTPARAERMRWYDRWLKGEQNGSDKEPAVNIWFETQFGAKYEAKPAWISTFGTWPPPELKWSTLYLTGSGALSAKPPAAGKESGQLSYIFPSGTELPYTNETFAVAPVKLGRVLYRSEPMAEDTAVLGAPLVTLYASLEEKDTDFMVALHDVDEQKNVTYMQRGFLRASHRAVDAAKSGLHEAYHPSDKVEELKPGQVYEFKIALFAVGQVLRRGHRLELAVMAPPTVPLPHWGFSLLPLPGQVQIHHSAEHPSTIELPILPGLKAQAPAPGCGSLKLQPCRPGR